MKNVQLLLVAMSLSLGVLAQAPQLHRNQNFSDSRPVDILTLDPSLERSLTLNNVNINPIQADIQALLLANDLAIYDIKSFVCRNYPTTFNNGSIGYENKVYMSKDNLEVSLRFGQSSLQVVSVASSGVKTLAIPYSSILFFSLENKELKVTLKN